MNEKELARAQECAETLIEREYDMYDLEYMDLEIKKMFPALVAEVRRLSAENALTQTESERRRSELTVMLNERLLPLEQENARLTSELAEMTEDRDSENRWAKTYFDHWNASRNDVEMLRAALEASEKVCKIISEYMSSGEFFDPETSKAIYEWQALKGGAQ